ncbi:ATP-binding cassette, subfamily B [Kytococcus aerolatus]|uniref:ATP-binding cassette, subfamily B n=1 Tax=Kytococcus aerolatus TaxID=592308 RepID=A0A212TZW1_9MICO|nr:ABC transporter ATP-binding protein [Kytococcus aerolatus]SNC71411.1 ATP-binding cassette, subfamily B [Kytococcus aerolatus]
MRTDVPQPAALTSAWFVTRAAWRNGPLAFCLSLLEPLANVLGAMSPLFIGMVVAGAIEHDATRLTLGTVGLVGSMGLLSTLVLTGLTQRMHVNDRLGFEFDQRSGRQSGTTPTLDHLVDPAHRDTLQVLTERRGAMGLAFQSLVNLLNNVGSVAASLVVAFLVDPRLLLLGIGLVPALWAARKVTTWDAEGEERSAPQGRLSGHLLEARSTPASAAELRVMGARDHLARLSEEATRSWRRPVLRAERRGALLNATVSTLYLAAGGTVLWWMLQDVLAGRLGPGTVAAAIVVVSELPQQATQLLGVSFQAARSTRIGRRALWLERYAEASTHPGELPPPPGLVDGIRLEGVTFTYPGAQRPTFTGLDLHLPAGATVAVVGENGAGKSTLVNLLTGMYSLDAGQVLVDGVPLTELDLEAWRARCSGAFQDHVALHTTAREAIRVGALEAPEDDAIVHAALERAAATDVLRALPDGLDTPLGPEHGGVGLSGGQWQRLAIARGMMRTAPLLQVLDEPTSALDPATEHALFDGFAEAGRRSRAEGGITLLITHRFSTVSAADLVVVLHEGQVAEMGTHDELLAAGGRYAELYALQASGYR